jgi:hypothetical protein
MKLKELLIGRVGGGQWSCEICFTLTTARQFTDEMHNVHRVSKTWYGALWKSIREVRQIVRLLGAKRNERKAKGWAP